MNKIEKNKEKRSSKNKKKNESKIKFNKCFNHPGKRAIRYCENCDNSYCNDCLIEFWSHNFISYAYLGEEKNFRKEFLCKNCAKKKRRKGVLMATSLLIILSLFIGFSIYNA